MTPFQIILVAIFAAVLLVLTLGTWFLQQISSRLHSWELDKRVTSKTAEEEERIMEVEVKKATVALESYEAETRLEVKTDEAESDSSLDELRELRRK